MWNNLADSCILALIRVPSGMDNSIIIIPSGKTLLVAALHCIEHVIILGKDFCMPHRLGLNSREAAATSVQ